MKNTKKYSENKGDNYPMVGNFVHHHILEHKIRKVDVSRSLGILPTGLNEYFKRETLQFAVLWKLSLAMQHNFLAQLAEYLPYHFETIHEKALLKELAEKEAQIQKMEIQIEVYKEMIK